MIPTEVHDEQPNVATITCGGTRTKVDATNQGNRIHQWARKSIEPMSLFDPAKEKDTYKKERKEVIGEKWIATTSIAPPLYNRSSVYNMPPVYDHTDTERQFEKVRTLKSFLKSCLELMKDKTALSILRGMIDHCVQDTEEVIVQQTINQVHQKRRMNREF
jgi:hypothetical protein